jgi:mannopine transport system permease protein
MTQARRDVHQDRLTSAIGGLGRVVFWAFVALVLAFLILPSVLIVPMSLSSSDFLEFPPSGWSLRWYEEYLNDPSWTGPTAFSFQIAALTTILATTVGTMAALALVRGEIRGRAAVNAAIIAPLIVPLIVYAVAVLLLFSPLRWTGTLHGFVLAHASLATPYVVLLVGAALYRTDPNLELAAMSLGASRARAIMKVTLPLIAPAILAGAVFAFLASFDDATVSFFISGITDKSLPRKLFENIEFSISPIVAVVSTLLTVISIVLIAVARLVLLRQPRPAVPDGDEAPIAAPDDDRWVAVGGRR